MAQCFHRKLAWLVEGEGLFFKKPFGKSSRPVTVPCGKCLPCRVNNAAQWATRCMHEDEYCENSCFITLTYNPEHCPKDYALDKSHLQGFMKRLRTYLDRKKLGHIRAFFACGEYGEKKGRPHYHLVLLGFCPPDLVFHSYSDSGAPIYTSNIIQSAWTHPKTKKPIGFCPVGTLTGGSAAYVARYQKKCSKDNSGLRTKPFFLSSRNIPLQFPDSSKVAFGALGAQWLIDHHQSLRFGYIKHPEKDDVRLRIPEYYFDLLEKWYKDEYNVIKDLRYDFAMSHTGGFLLCDDPLSHNPSFIISDYLSDDDIRELRMFAGYDPDTSIPLSHLLRECREKLTKQEEAQLARLMTLKRNYHNEH